MAENDRPGASLETALRNVFGRLPAGYEARESYDAQTLKGTGAIEEEFLAMGDDDIDIAGINIGYSPLDGTAVVYLYARTDCEVEEAIGSLQLMQSRLARLGAEGYDVSSSRLKHEAETTFAKEYEIDIPVRRQEELDALLETLKKIS